MAERPRLPDPRRWSLRLRVFLFFALLAAAAAGALAAGGALTWRRLPEAARDAAALSALAAGGVAALSLMWAALAWTWLRFDEHVARPLQELASALRRRAHAPVATPVDPEAARWLGELAPAAAELTEALGRLRGDVSEEVARRTRELDARREQLELVLANLPEAVLICTLDHRVMLYNRRALALLPDVEEVGLGRSLARMVRIEPIEHALAALRARPEADGAPVLCETARGGALLQGRAALARGPDGAPRGYILTLRDVTAQMAAELARERLLGDALEGVRRAAANVEALSEAAAGARDEGARARLTAELRAQAATLAERLRALSRESREAMSAHWPVAPVAVADLFEALRRRIQDRPAPERPEIEIAAAEGVVSCDALAIVRVLELALRRLALRGVGRVRLSARPGRAWLRLEIRWSGPPLTDSDLAELLAEPIDLGAGALTGAEALDRLRTQMWPAREGGEWALRLPLPAAAPSQTPRDALDRPEFYDFDLMARAAPAPQDDTPLRRLDCVVFDTETTGLNPARDEIVQIAGVRIVNGRLLRGETFERLARPSRPIPAAATRIHGIDDAMVADAPPVEEVALRFHDWVEDAALVAHNAPFDIAFLRAVEPRIGRRFDNPAIDTVLISTILDPHSALHTLDALAERFDVRIPPERRHTALGDAMATAEIYLRAIPLLERAGVRTLGELRAASQRIADIRRAQAAYAPKNAARTNP
ncbi:3'-5' exonuclease [Oceanicella actignis]|uniref:3'-5' exonuclease n=1 Tax=Oceanicella actignis TaxID=1189325 RepID=UPI0011E8343E|nr:exonuclease domain-containing protein [Oceanicella actignis]TYO84645.1 DNA polymerase-3 subunit epsilon [Oceanicella actignis]